MLTDEDSIAAAWKTLLKTGLSKGQSLSVPEDANRPTRYTREQLFRRAVQICNALHRKLEVPKYGRVALIANVDAHYAAICHGCWLGKHSVVLLNPQMDKDKLVAAINNAEVDTVFFAMSQMITMSKIIKSCPTVRHWVLTEGSGVNGHGTSLHIMNNLLGDTSKTIISTLDDAAEDYPALISFTSGYNGKLTGVAFTEHQLLAGADNIIRHFSLRQSPTHAILTLLEPHHLLSAQWSALVPLGCMNTIVTLDMSNAKRFWAVVEKNPAHHLFIDQGAFGQIPKSTKAKYANLPEKASFHIVTNEVFDPSKIKAFRSITQREVHPCYHQSEAGGLVAAVNSPLEETLSHVRSVMCCGTPLPNISIAIRLADGKTALPAHEGEIEVESPQVMLGYEATTPGDAQLSSESSVRTSDRGFIVPTDDGGTFLYVINRLSDPLPELEPAPVHEVEDIDNGHVDEIKCISGDTLRPQNTTADPSSLSELPPDQANLAQLLKLARDPNARTPALTEAFLRDPVLTIELIRTYQYASERSSGAPLQDIKDIIVLLGPSLIQELCEQLQQRQQFHDPTTAKWVNINRKRCVKAGNIAFSIASKLRGSNPEEARLAAMLKEVGDLEFLCKHPQEYVEHAETLPRVKLVYQMSKKHGFHPDNTAITYLKRMQCPPNLLELIDPEVSPSAAEKTKLRMICKAASEVAELDSQKNLEKLAPDKTLSSRSALRVLQIPSNQYAELFEDFSDIITQVDTPQKPKVEQCSLESNEKEAALDTHPKDKEADQIESINADADETLSNLNEFLDALEEEPIQSSQVLNAESIDEQEQSQEGLDRPTPIMAPKLNIEKPVPRFNTVAVDAMVARSAAIIAGQKTPMEKVSAIMSSMIDQSPFTRSALLLVDLDTLEVQVLESVGMDFENGGVHIIENPDSPFLSKDVQIYSFSKKGKHKTHFGSTTYAMGPIVQVASQMLLIYSDCGANEVLPFASRRMFRQLLNLLQEHCSDILHDENHGAAIEQRDSN